MVSYVVTGANRGIGLAFIQTLSADPKNVVFALTRNKANSTALLDVASKAKNVHVLQADVTDVPSLRSAAKEVEKVTGGTLNVLINNGAYMTQDRIEYTLDLYDGKEDLLDQDFDQYFKVNVLGVIKTTNMFLPLLRNAAKASLAKVITLGSPAGDIEFVVKTGFDFFAAYSLSKAAANMVTAKYAAKFKNENLLFLTLSPGVVNTAGDLPREAVLEAYGPFINTFKRGYPEWEGIPLNPDESVKAMLTTVSKLTAKDTGISISHHGSSKNWL